MKSWISFVGLFLFLGLAISCVERQSNESETQIISDSIRIQDSLQIQLWLDSLSAETDSLKKVDSLLKRKP